MLLDLGAGSLLIFGNLIKLLKRHYQLGVVGESRVSLVELLTLLGMRRPNSIVLEQVLYDLLLNHLLLNMKPLLSTASQEERWEVLLTLLKVDLGHCYRSDSGLWRSWTVHLLDQAVSEVKNEWGTSWIQENEDRDVKVLLLLESVEKTRRGHLHDDCSWNKC